jgi:hypothetical protein
MANRERMAMPSLERTNENSWRRSYAMEIANGPRTRRIPKFALLDNMAVVEHKKIIVHAFTMGDVDDPDLYAAEPLYQWQKSEAGTWVMENAADTPEWHRQNDHTSFGHKYIVTAVFEMKKLTEYYLRFGKTSG